MKIYELTYLISPEVSEEELKSSQEKIIFLIQNEGGIFNGANSTIKKTLFYPIKKRQSAYLASLTFQSAPEKLEVLEKKLKAEEKILRYLILSKPKTKPPTTFRKKMFLGKPPIPRKKVVGGKVELKEIEKKLEEILGE
jgi:small subunit ribosomal protein S6